MKRVLTFTALRAASSVSPPTLSQKLLNGGVSAQNLAFGKAVNAHINSSLLLQNLERVFGLIVESNIGADTCHELNRFVKPSGGDNLATIGLGELDDEPGFARSAIGEGNEDQGTHEPTGPAPALTKAVSPFFAPEYSFHAMYAVFPGIPHTPT